MIHVLAKSATALILEFIYHINLHAKLSSYPRKAKRKIWDKLRVINDIKGIWYVAYSYGVLLIYLTC